MHKPAVVVLSCPFNWDSVDDCPYQYLFRSALRSDNSRVHWSMCFCTGKGPVCIAQFEDPNGFTDPFFISLDRFSGETFFLHAEKNRS